MSEITPFGSLPSGTAWPDTVGWCGHNGTIYKFQVGSLNLNLCEDCFNQVGKNWLKVIRGDIKHD